MSKPMPKSDVFPPSHPPGAASTRRPSNSGPQSPNRVTVDENVTPRVDDMTLPSVY